MIKSWLHVLYTLVLLHVRSRIYMYTPSPNTSRHPAWCYRMCQYSPSNVSKIGRASTSFSPRCLVPAYCAPLPPRHLTLSLPCRVSTLFPCLRSYVLVLVSLASFFLVSSCLRVFVSRYPRHPFLLSSSSRILAPFLYLSPHLLFGQFL